MPAIKVSQFDDENEKFRKSSNNKYKYIKQD